MQEFKRLNPETKVDLGGEQFSVLLRNSKIYVVSTVKLLLCSCIFFIDVYGLQML